MPSHDEIVGTFKPGSVTRILLVNFLTYSKVEFRPGPRLNLVCGPNGTGKSTILNAMCLGLGGEPPALGRADDAREFIAHGEDKALVEIEVQPQPGKPTHIFRRVIDRNKGSERGRGRGASTFFINGNSCSKKDILELVKSYNISIENLCTFLPQDRVGSFSGFNSKQLMEETEKSLSTSGHLYDTHKNLIQLEADFAQGDNTVETMQSKLKKLQADFENMEREKERMEERQEALEQIQLLQQKILWLQYDQQREACIELKKEKDAAKQLLAEARTKVAPLEERTATLESRLQRGRAKFQTLDRQSQDAKQKMQKHANKYETHASEFENVMFSLQAVDSDKRRLERDVEKAAKDLKDEEARLEGQPDPAELKTQMQEEKAEYTQHSQPLNQKNQQLRHANDEHGDAERLIKTSQADLDKLNDAKRNRRKKVFQKFNNLEKIAAWVKANGKLFRRPVWGPVACEVDIKSRNAAAFLEQHVPNHVWKAFVVEDRKDYDLLYQKIRQEMNLPINILTVKDGKLQPFNPMYSANKSEILKREHGVIGSMDESFTAPDPIMQALRNEASVHKVLIGSEKSQASIDGKGLIDFLTQPEDGSRNLKGCCIFSSKGEKSYKYTCSISRYSGKPSMRVDDISPAGFLGADVNPAKKEKAERDLEQAKQKAEGSSSQLRALQEEKDEIIRVYNEGKARFDATKSKYDGLNKLRKRVDGARRKLETAQEKAAVDNTAEKKRLVKQLMARVKNTISAIESHGENNAALLSATFKNAGVRLNESMIDNEYRLVRSELREASIELTDFVRREAAAKTTLTAAKQRMNAKLRECRTAAPLMDDDNEPLPLKEKLEQLPVETIEEAQAALEEADAKANSIDENPDVMIQYEKLKQDIVETKDELDNLGDAKDAQLQEIQRLKEPWEAALDNSLSKVNTLFAQYMQELGCAGEIVLRKGSAEPPPAATPGTQEPVTHNFADWGVEIQVKFREKAKMAVLSAQRHSGGERSVSTIMYLMALQELMVSPFRCVDEINQGLDERNERLVFRRIVQNSTKPPTRDDLTNHSGQYFLITPKLLPNLTDMEEEAVTVHIITNGPLTFENPRDWNPNEFVQARAGQIEELPAGSDEEAGGGGDEPVGDENSPDVANANVAEPSDDDPALKRRKKRRVS